MTTTPAPPSRHLVISASAGSGKTYQLSNRYLQLLAGSAPVDSILAATFTRKAAGEIQSRIVLRLAKAAESEEECRRLSEALGASPALSVARCRQLLRTAADNLHRLRIGTLDSFFAKVASGYSLELGLPVGWRIVDADEETRLADEALQRVLARESTQDVLSLLSMLTKGETTRSVVGLLRSTVEESYAIFRDTPAEAWTRLSRPPGLTAESIAAALDELRQLDLTSNSRMKGARDGDIANFESQDWSVFLGKGLAAKVADRSLKYYSKEIPAPAVAIYERLVRHAAGELIGQTIFQTKAAYDWLWRYHVELEKLKQERSALRFDDISFGLAKLGGDSERLAWRLDGAIDHLLLDEFQDTSLSQWSVMRPLAERLTSGAVESGAFFCVGDVKQAIYGWRGGVARLLEMLDSELPNLEQERLSASRRSSPVVIDAVNRVFQALDQLPGDDGPLSAALSRWRDAFPEHTTTREGLPGLVVLETSDAPADGQKPQEAVFDFAARKIRDLALATPGCEIGVLTRTNEAVNRMVYLLQKLGVAASEEGGQPLVDSPAVELILSLLVLIDHPGDTIARYHVARSALGEAIGFTDWREIWPSTQLAAKLRRQLHERGYGPTIAAWAANLADCCEPRDRQRLAQLVELAYEYRPSVTCRPTDFVARIEARKVAEPTSAPVRVMTVHQAKGLEFDIVVLPELDKKLKPKESNYAVHRPTPIAPADCVSRYASAAVRNFFPADLAGMFDEATENQVGESLCLLYVALTRARQALHLCIAPSKDNEKTMPKTFAGLLRSTLHGNDQVVPRQVLFESGDANWATANWATGSGGEPVAQPTGGAPAIPNKIQFRAAGEVRRHLMRRSPSSLEGGEKVKLGPIIERTDGNLGLQYGKLIHAWFELVEWLDEGPPSHEKRREAAALCEAGAVLNTAWGDFDAMLARPAIAANLRRDAYADFLKRGRRLEVRNEFPFAYRDDDVLMNGSIDRFVRVYDGKKLVAAEIIDFKTDNLEPSGGQSLKSKTDYYRPQIAAYRRAIGAMSGLDPTRIGAKLLFVGSGIVQEISP